MAYEFFRQLNEGKLHSRMQFQGMDISIEIPAGGKRTGVNKAGEKWENEIDDAYGYIKGTHSPDGEHLDCYVRRNPDKDADVYVMHQMTVDGSKFDEDKVMLGYSSAAEATKAFKKFTFKPKEMFGGMSEFCLDHFKVVAYQASRSSAMLASEETYEDFKKRNLLPKGVKSPIDVAKRVSEGSEKEAHLQTLTQLAGVKANTDGPKSPVSPRDWADKLARLEARRDPEGLETWCEETQQYIRKPDNQK